MREKCERPGLRKFEFLEMVYLEKYLLPGLAAVGRVPQNFNCACVRACVRVCVCVCVRVFFF